MEQVKRRELTAEERECLERNVDENIMPQIRAGMEEARIRAIVRQELMQLLTEGLRGWL